LNAPNALGFRLRLGGGVALRLRSSRLSVCVSLFPLADPRPNEQRCKPPVLFQQSQIIGRIQLNHFGVNQTGAREQTNFRRILDHTRKNFSTLDRPCAAITARPEEKPAKRSSRKSLMNCPWRKNEGRVSGRIFLKLGEALKDLNFHVLFGINENRYTIPKPAAF
jgi:hypothetical protein